MCILVSKDRMKDEVRINISLMVPVWLMFSVPVFVELLDLKRAHLCQILKHRFQSKKKFLKNAEARDTIRTYLRKGPRKKNNYKCRKPFFKHYGKQEEMYSESLQHVSGQVSCLSHSISDRS